MTTPTLPTPPRPSIKGRWADAERHPINATPSTAQQDIADMAAAAAAAGIPPGEALR